MQLRILPLGGRILKRSNDTLIVWDKLHVLRSYCLTAVAHSLRILGWTWCVDVHDEFPKVIFKCSTLFSSTVSILSCAAAYVHGPLPKGSVSKKRHIQFSFYTRPHVTATDFYCTVTILPQCREPCASNVRLINTLIDKHDVGVWIIYRMLGLWQSQAAQQRKV